MTATFGKLEHATLTLENGLNIIEAPNEWGKSTWCSFLVAMLYGIETRAKSTKTALSDKEHFQPWSGSPMTGRIDLNWNGRDITIERSTKGRVPMGQFSAYETQSGIAVPELTAANCGQQLLGIERSVFLRSGFIRLSDMPVAQDEVLRKRLNALVTTGDESGDAERLSAQLKELKNRVRHNRTGILPQAESERAAVDEKLRELQTLETQSSELTARAERLGAEIRLLENHERHIAYARAQEDIARVRAAQLAAKESDAKLEAAQALCADYPPRETAWQTLARLKELSDEGLRLQLEQSEPLSMPELPLAPTAFASLTPQQAHECAKADSERYDALRKNRSFLLLFAAAALVLGVLSAFLAPSVAAIVLVLALALFLADRRQAAKRKAARAELEQKYASSDPTAWCASADLWARSYAEAEQMRAQVAQLTQERQGKMRAWQSRVDALTQGISLSDAERHWQTVLSAWDVLARAERECAQAHDHLRTLSAMLRAVDQPTEADVLSLSEQETARALADAREQWHLLQSRLSQYEGRMEALGDREALRVLRTKLDERIARLEDYDSALVIARQTLTDATLMLQRRFAPQIANRARTVMSSLTGGRYDRLNLSEELGLRSGAGEEDTLRDPLWRSDGTVDQLYLSLRLAVSQALSPDAPLVLDDALVRFDDTRLKAALGVLKTESETKQILLFTCQSREKRLLAELS